MKLSNGIHIEQFTSGDPGKGLVFNAVSAIRLSSCPSSRLREVSIQGYPIPFTAKTIDLINTLYQSEVKLSYAIRFISRPHATSFSGGHIDICLFCKVSASDAVTALSLAQDRTEQVLVQLCGSLPDHVWSIVKDPEQFQQFWRPVNWETADLIEVRRREELIALDTVRSSHGLGFTGAREAGKAKKGELLYYVHPFLPHPGQLERLLRVMLLHNAPIVYTAIISPICLAEEEEQSLLDEISFSEGYQVDPQPNLHRIQEQRAEMICQSLLGQLLKLQDAPFYLTTSLASSHRIPRTIAEATGVAISASVGENPGSVYPEPTFIQMGGYDVPAPMNHKERAIARNNTATLSQDPWGKSLADGNMTRIRFLVDGHEAVNAFRFPEDSGEGLPGITVHTQRMRPIPPELIPDPKHKDASRTLLLGTNTYLGVPQEVYLPEKDRLTHMYVVGQTGTGKTTLLKTMILSDIKEGRGCALIDPHGDLFEELLGLIPPERMEDVVVFDPSDLDHPVGLNLLEAHSRDERYFVIREMQAIMRRLLDDQYGYYSKEYTGPVFYQHMQMNMLLAMSDPEDPGTLLEFHQIFQSQDYWKRWIPLKIDDAELRSWVNMLNNLDYTSAKAGETSFGNYFSGKFTDFIFDPRLRGIFGQKSSSINLEEVMNQGKILMVNLAKGLLGESNSRFLGLVLMAKLQAEAMKRAHLPASRRKPFFLYVDEFQSLATENFTVLLSEARKFGIGMVLANQFISQIKDERIMQAVFGNVGSFLSFRLGREDAQLIEPQYLPYYDRVDLSNLPNWQIAARTTVHGKGLPPFTIQTILPPSEPDPAVAAQVREISRRKYNRPRKEVEEIITKSLSESEPKKLQFD